VGSVLSGFEGMKPHSFCQINRAYYFFGVSLILLIMLRTPFPAFPQGGRSKKIISPLGKTGKGVCINAG